MNESQSAYSQTLWHVKKLLAARIKLQPMYLKAHSNRTSKKVAKMSRICVAKTKRLEDTLTERYWGKLPDNIKDRNMRVRELICQTGDILLDQNSKNFRSFAQSYTNRVMIAYKSENKLSKMHTRKEDTSYDYSTYNDHETYIRLMNEALNGCASVSLNLEQAINQERKRIKDEKKTSDTYNNKIKTKTLESLKHYWTSNSQKDNSAEIFKSIKLPLY